MPKPSRYAAVKPFAPDPIGRASFKGLLPRPIAPPPGVVEHTIVAGTRLDHLSLAYFNDDRLWWRIVDANADLLCATDMVAAPAEDAGAGDAPGAPTVGQRIIVPARE
jgi:hypothetical protein